jgi:hypothetical protein
MKLSLFINHIQTSTPTIAGAAATRDTAKHTTKKYIGSIGQYRLSISQKSTGPHDTTDHKTRMERLTKRLQELKMALASSLHHRISRALKKISGDWIRLKENLRRPDQVRKQNLRRLHPVRGKSQATGPTSRKVSGDCIQERSRTCHSRV